MGGQTDDGTVDLEKIIFNDGKTGSVLKELSKKIVEKADNLAKKDKTAMRSEPIYRDQDSLIHINNFLKAVKTRTLPLPKNPVSYYTETHEDIRLLFITEERISIVYRWDGRNWICDGYHWEQQP